MSTDLLENIMRMTVDKVRILRAGNVIQSPQRNPENPTMPTPPRLRTPSLLRNLMVIQIARKTSRLLSENSQIDEEDEAEEEEDDNEVQQSQDEEPQPTEIATVHCPVPTVTLTPTPVAPRPLDATPSPVGGKRRPSDEEESDHDEDSLDSDDADAPPPLKSPRTADVPTFVFPPPQEAFKQMRLESPRQLHSGMSPVFPACSEVRTWTTPEKPIQPFICQPMRN